MAEIDTIEPELGTPFDILFKPAVQSRSPGTAGGYLAFIRCRGFEHTQ